MVDVSQVLEYAQNVYLLAAFSIGIRFKYPLIWFLVEEYQSQYQLCDYKEESWSHQLMAYQGYRAAEEDTANAYTLTDLHMKYNSKL